MPVAEPETLQMILGHYQRGAEARHHEDLWWAAAGLSFEAACERASKALLENGTIHSHHRRPGSAVMRNFAQVIVASTTELSKEKTFEDLLEQIERLAKGVRGAGELVAYDVADRIGLHLGLSPESVYLHRGTRTGAHRLGLGTTPNTRTVNVRDLPHPLDALTPRDAENVLCTYKDAFLLNPEDCLQVLADKPGGVCPPRTPPQQLLGI